MNLLNNYVKTGDLRNILWGEDSIFEKYLTEVWSFELHIKMYHQMSIFSGDL